MFCPDNFLFWQSFGLPFSSHYYILKKVYSETSKIKCLFCPEDENLLCFLFQSIHLILDIWHLHEVPENCPKGFPITQNMDFDPRTMSLACSEAELLPKLDFHFLKSSSTPYSLSTPFLTVRWIWGFWKWSLMIPHHPKHGVWHQNHDHGTFRS